MTSLTGEHRAIRVHSRCGTAALPLWVRLRDRLFEIDRRWRDAQRMKTIDDHRLDDMGLERWGGEVTRKAKV
ncbi:hypothetical protein [Pararhodobacter sp. SW119]|uniref:hypothetical protein n=1 Tax=Pararhodobacter sp. SW119 TaxID=2780075 RepID=UPI001AE086BB|nr:hypothetical protein [Pararhodobacter sp. SW119]